MATISPERKELLTGTTFELEVHPVEMILERNPETNEAFLTWRWREHLSVDGTVRLKESTRTGSTFREYSEIQTAQPSYPGAVDPNTGADLTQISIAGVVQILLDAFDRAYVQDYNS